MQPCNGNTDKSTSMHFWMNMRKYGLFDRNMSGIKTGKNWLTYPWREYNLEHLFKGCDNFG